MLSILLKFFVNCIANDVYMKLLHVSKDEETSGLVVVVEMMRVANWNDGLAAITL